MTTKTKLLSSSLLSSLALAALAQPAFAQETAPIDDPVSVEEFVVTGTRLRLQDFVSPNPVSTVTSDAIERSGITNVTDLMKDYPALVGSSDSQTFSDAGLRSNVGLNLLNLRNLGVDRTLVLVDGRRHVAGTPGSAAVDTNSIPVGLIERVEVLTGGASAIYGADGVSGVVNFITKRDFEGLDMRAQYGWSDGGGGENTFLSAVAGRNFMDGRLNITGALEYSNTEPLDPQDRSFSRLGQREILVDNPAFEDQADPNFDPGPWGTTDRVFARDVRYIDSAVGGGVYTNVNAATRSGISFYGDGSPWRDGINAGGFSMIGGSGSPLDLFQTELTPGIERWTAYGAGTFEYAPNHRVFGELKYVNAKTSFTSQPTFDYGIFISPDNPYIPASVLADAQSPGGLATQEGAELFELPEPGLLLARDNFDLGRIRRDIERETFRAVIGLEGDFSPTVSYNFSYVYGQTKEDNRELNNRNNERWFAAIDAVRNPANGQIVCRSDLDPSAIPYGDLSGRPTDPASWGETFAPGPGSGCVPVNLFGENTVSDAARAWINGTARSRAKIEQHVVSAFISGDSSQAFELPAGPVSFVLGAEYRKEISNATPSDEELRGAELGYDLTWLGQGTITDGEFDVAELYGELGIPLLRDMRFAKSVNLNLAYRFSDYSTSGATDTWSIGGQWRVNDDLMFRATRARAVRAPNIGELFLPQTQTFEILTDPCESDNVQAGTEFRVANCTAALGFNPLEQDFNNTTSASVEGVIGGNPDLNPEKGDTETYGVVFTPTFAPGLSISLDYYKIRLRDAINFFEANTIIESCYDLAQPNEFCGLFTRSPSDQFIDSFQEFAINVSQYETAGFDLSIQYNLDPTRFGVERDIGTFQFSLLANKLETLEFIEIEGADVSSEVGYVGAPKWQANLDVTWQWKNLLVNYGFNWFDETKRFTDERRASNPTYVEDRYWTYKARATHDIQAQYDLMDRYSLYGGINNFTDQRPDRGTTGLESTGAAAFTEGPTPVGPLGRFFYLGVKARFN
jgi:outer membrane receptor protein involved in Fe transport